MKCAICNEETIGTNAKMWGCDFAHVTCIKAYSLGTNDVRATVQAAQPEAVGCDEYFKARPQLESAVNRGIFEAGYSAARLGAAGDVEAHTYKIELAASRYATDFAKYCDTQALTDFRICRVSMATLQTAIRSGLLASAPTPEPMSAPTAEPVEQGIGPEVGQGRNMFYEGRFDNESEREQKARLQWANDMRAAFERHTGNGWFDKNWYAETGIWAAAWRAALATPPSAATPETNAENRWRKAANDWAKCLGATLQKADEPLQIIRVLIERDRATRFPEQSDAERYQLVRRGQHWSVIDGTGNVLRGDDLDVAIDAIRATKGGKL